MDSLKKILFILLAVFYLFLSTGVTLLKTHCLCSDSTNISLFVKSGSCSDVDTQNSCCTEEEESNNSFRIEHLSHSCGCDSLEVTYLKLSNHFDEDSRLEYPLEKQLCLLYNPESLFDKPIILTEEISAYPNYSPPENYFFGRYLLNYISQRKIALLV